MFTNKYLRKYYLHYAFFLLIGIAILVAVDYIQLFLPEFLGRITKNFRLASESGFTEEMKKDITEVCLYTFYVALGIMVGRMLWRYTIFHASKGIEAGLRHDMFLKAEKLPIEYYHTNSVGTVMSWFTADIETIEEFIGWGTVMMVDGLFLSILTAVKMVQFNLAMSLLLVFPLLLIIIWGALVEKLMSDRWEKRQQANDELYDYSRESITGIRVIKAFVKERQELKSFSKVARKNQVVNVRFITLYYLFDIIIEILLAAMSVLVLWLGCYFVYLTAHGGTPELFGIRFTFHIEDMVQMLGYMDTIIWPMIALGQIISSYSRSKTSMKRITRFLDAPEIIVDSKDAKEIDHVKGEIVIKDLTFVYPGCKKPNLKNVSLTIKPGEKVGVVGKIGSGKTTLMYTLVRFYNVEKGKIFIDGVDIMDYKLDSLRHAISYAPQDNFLFSDTIQRNIAFGDVEQSMEEVQEAARFACIDDDITGFSKNYQTVSGERGVTLSGGQKQRIAIARAYLSHAPILILDDSVSAVDVKTEETILKNIHDARQGMTTIVVSSRVSTVKDLDKIIVLNDGEVEAFDTPKNLLEISPTYKRMYLLQQLEEEKPVRKEEERHED